MSFVCTSLNSLPVWLYLVAWFLKTKQAPIKVHIFSLNGQTYMLFENEKKATVNH